VTEAADHPVKPTILRSRKRRDSFSVGSDMSTTSPPRAQKLEQNIPPKVSLDHTLVLSAPLAFSSYMQRIDEPVMIGPLPEMAWAKILLMVADEMGVLSEQQRRMIMKYARDRRSLDGEKESRGKAESVQVWRCLEGMGGLEYDGL
jgi:hypothetical protein